MAPGEAIGMEVCPLDYRYGSDEMREIFSEGGRLKRMLEVEAALARAQAQLGMVPQWAAESITEVARSGRVTAARVDEIESEIKHDVMALVRAMSEQAGDAGAFIHLGATSNDIIDTATAMQLKEAMPHIERGVRAVRDELARLARENARTPQIGRTHGQWALPTTFGLKMSVYALEMDRHLQRLHEATPRIVVG